MPFKDIKYIIYIMDGAEAIKYILKNNIEGAVIECGVQNGRFELIWINELMANNAIRDIYMYDTFAGLTKPGTNDYTIGNNNCNMNFYKRRCFTNFGLKTK